MIRRLGNGQIVLMAEGQPPLVCSEADFEEARKIVASLRAATPVVRDARRRADAEQAEPGTELPVSVARTTSPVVADAMKRRKEAAERVDEAIDEAREEERRQMPIGRALVKDAMRRAAKAEGKTLSLQANNQPTVPAGAAASPNRTKARRKAAIEKLAAFAEESRELRGPAIEAQRQRLVEECRAAGCDRQLVASLSRAARSGNGKRIQQQRQRKESNR